jgi:hypothetical protein
MIRPLRIDEIGGARFRQKQNVGGRQRYALEEIPLGELRSWLPNNRDIMIQKGMIEVWAKNVAFTRPAQAPPGWRGEEAFGDPRDGSMSSAMLEHPDMPAKKREPDDDVSRIIVPRGFGHYDVVEGRVLATNVTKDEAHAIAGTPRAAVQPAAPAKAGRKAATNKPRSQAEPPKMPEGVAPKDDDQENGPI